MLSICQQSIYLLKTNLILVEILALILGLAIGSFLNVVILRYPEMLKRMWRKECKEFLKHEGPKIQIEVFNLHHPASHCPHCKKLLRWFHNIPVVSYFSLRGRCAFCEKRISILYPTIELLTALLSVIVVMHYHISCQMIAGLLFTWILIAMTFMDINEQFIPDDCNYILLWSGLFLSTGSFFTTPVQSILGAIVGYVGLWIIAKLFQVFRKKEGMGHGDFKLLAALGAWFGLQAVPVILFIGVITCLIITLVIFMFKKLKFDTPIPFGPFLALGGWMMLIWKAPLLTFAAHIFLGS